MVSKGHFFGFISLPPVVQLRWLWKWRIFLALRLYWKSQCEFWSTDSSHSSSHSGPQVTFETAEKLPTIPCPTKRLPQGLLHKIQMCMSEANAYFLADFLGRASVSRGSVVCPGGSVLSPSRVCVLMGCLNAAFQKLSLIGLLVFLSRFCTDTGSLFLHNLIINYYFKKPFLGGMQHTLFELFEASRGISLFPSHLERVYFLFSLLLAFPPLLLCSSPSCCFSIPVTLKAGSQTMWKEEGQLL